MTEESQSCFDTISAAVTAGAERLVRVNGDDRPLMRPRPWGTRHHSVAIMSEDVAQMGPMLIIAWTLDPGPMAPRTTLPSWREPPARQKFVVPSGRARH